jgi:choline dehydrogenase-like flavoprotein
MILEPERLDRADLDAQVCIVGAGPVGISIALELARHDLDVLLVVGGGPRETPEDRCLNAGRIDPPGSHEPLEEGRCRGWGGTTRVWGGRLVVFDPIDFESRAYVPLSGWPVQYAQIARYFRRATELCDVAAHDYRVAADPIVPGRLGESIETTSCERWSSPTDFGSSHGSSLFGMRNVRILMNYHAAELRLRDELDTVSHIRIVSRRGRPLNVRARLAVLAAGGLENARLLLTSRNQLPNGIGNETGMVGRCYMSHVSGTCGRLILEAACRKKLYPLYREQDGTYYRRRFRLSDERQLELGVLNIIGFPLRPPIRDPHHHDAVLSLLFLEECMRQRRLPPLGTAGRHVANIVFNNPAAWASAVRQAWLRTRRPRLPFVVPYTRRAQEAFCFQSEHAPNRESRLLLSDELDELGMPRMTPQVRFSEIDFRTVRHFYREVDRSLRTHGLGALEYDSAELDRHLEALQERFNSAGHHIGTTRMSSRPELGVVDADCRVHSLKNLYVCGSSVFPTSGHANPTLTALALSLRLADHLSQELGSITAEAA